jgi:hypothetical protein
MLFSVPLVSHLDNTRNLGSPPAVGFQDFSSYNKRRPSCQDGCGLGSRKKTGGAVGQP